MTKQQKIEISNEIAKLWEIDPEEAIETVAGFRTYLEIHYSAFIDFGKWIDTRSELKYAYGKFLYRREVFEVTTLVTYKDNIKMAFDKLSNSIYQYPDEWIYYLLQENNELSDSQINDLKCQVFADRNGIPEQLGYAFKMILI
jgi:hypothetical protein